MTTKSESSSPIELTQKSLWTATASGVQGIKFKPELVFDNNCATRWSSPASDPQWLEIDLNRISTVTGFTINWENAYASGYKISTSVDKQKWRQAYLTENGDGKIDDIFINPVNARYIRLDGIKRATSWGYSIWEFDIKGPEKKVEIKTSAKNSSKESFLLDGKLETIWQGRIVNGSTIHLDFKGQKKLTGLRIDWGENFAKKIVLKVLKNGSDWQTVYETKNGVGKFDVLYHKLHETSQVKIVLYEINDPQQPVHIKEITISLNNEQISPFDIYKFAARKAPKGHYPTHLLDQQTYWTIIGVPGDTHESLVDEYGNIEPYHEANSLMPYIQLNNKTISALDVNSISQKLADGYLPMPTVNWSHDAFSFDIEAFTRGTPDNAVTFVKYTLNNTGKKSIEGSIFLAIRPMQINPKWQYGGISPITMIDGKNNIIKINDKKVYVSLTHYDQFSAAQFDQGDIIQHIISGKLPAETSQESKTGLLSGAMRYSFKLSGGEKKEVIVAMPLHKDLSIINNSTSFELLRSKSIKLWKEKLGRVQIDMPNKEIQNTIKTTIAYILLNQDRNVIQPGSRNYNRTWMRDGSITSASLMRFGLLDDARNYLEWYSQRVEDNGLVPPILYNNGAVYEGWGANIEWDSQGQFIYAMMEYYRFTKDRDFLAKHFDSIYRAMKYLVALTSRTKVPGYRASEKGAERYHGILPPSISHEGYSDPVHSNWDNFWAIRGWHDGIDAAKILNKVDVVEWAEKEYAIFKGNLTKSILKTIEHFKVKYIPSSADMGDSDPTSIAIGLFPCEALEVMPADILKNTFSEYFKKVKKRNASDKDYGYTPYENRNILALARLCMKDEAYQLHEILFNDRRPKAWNQFAEVVHSRERLGSYIGDMPHTWVGSGYVNSVRGMIVLEDDLKRKLQLLYATPNEWLQNGGLHFKKFPTHFGELELKALLKKDMLIVEINGEFEDLNEIEIFWPMKTKPKSVRVDGKLIKKINVNSVNVNLGAQKIVMQW
jgi:hypothetical protein